MYIHEKAICGFVTILLINTRRRNPCVCLYDAHACACVFVWNVPAKAGKMIPLVSKQGHKQYKSQMLLRGSKCTWDICWDVVFGWVMLDVNWNFVYLWENLAPDTLSCPLRSVQFVCAVFRISFENHYIVQLKHLNVPQHTYILYIVCLHTFSPEAGR